jgi:hypothetical protein
MKFGCHPTRRRAQAILAFVLVATTGTAAEPPAPTSRPADDLTRRLLRGDAGASDALSKMLDAMKDAQQRLRDGRDAGDETQKSQRAALAALDELLETAQQSQDDAARQRGASARERRRSASVTPQPPRRTGERRPGDGQAATTQPVAGGPGDRAGVSAGELPRRWGQLPARDRAELIQGLDEQMPVKYRSHIEDYYRSLAEESPP